MPRTTHRDRGPGQVQQAISARDRRLRAERRATVETRSFAPTPRNDLLPNIPKVMKRIDDLKVAKRMIRKVTEDQIARVMVSLQQFGFVTPVLIDGQNNIADGHSRWEAARRLGLTEIPCLVVDHLSPAELNLLKITLNRTAETGVWDFDALQKDLLELQEASFTLEVTGFTTQEIDGLLTLEEQPPERDEVTVPDRKASPVTRTGDIWRLGTHRVICGDARDPEVYKQLMGDDIAQLVLTDEPYNVPVVGHVTSGEHREFAMAAGEMTESEFEAFNKAWMALCLAYLAEGGLLGTFIDWRSVELVIRTGRGLGLALLNVIVWAKTNGGMGSLYRSHHEMLPMFKKGDKPHVNNVELGRHGRYRSNLWTYPGANVLGSDANTMLADHPTPKPVAMLEDALRDVTKSKDIVLDPFLGSGSTLIAAQGTGRQCRGIELDPLYVDLTLQRWESLTGKVAHLEATGQTFAEVRDARAGVIDVDLSAREPEADQ
ncbi:site-specific DNA-methyltransferase [Phenylobacterium conjunctum]|uniref:Methyltransferase n=1 Tax=Phenylobacterium conjunctum TaxID=1298959 RepID=A0ABW3T5F1_9CAUL